jgi:hypothetical protein
VRGCGQLRDADRSPSRNAYSNNRGGSAPPVSLTRRSAELHAVGGRTVGARYKTVSLRLPATVIASVIDDRLK